MPRTDSYQLFMTDLLKAVEDTKTALMKIADEENGPGHSANASSSDSASHMRRAGSMHKEAARLRIRLGILSRRFRRLEAHER